jgi:hypothetical protein
MLQPKSGRMTRSPGIVDRIIRMEASSSAAPLYSRTEPPRVIAAGKPQPLPMKSPR